MPAESGFIPSCPSSKGRTETTHGVLRTLCVAFLLLSATAFAIEIEGVKLPDRVRIGRDGPELVLNGAGVREQMVFRIYVSALYLPAKNHDGEAILRKDQPRRLVPHFLRTVTAKQFTTSTNDALRDTLTPVERRPLESRMMQFNAILETLPEVKKGMEIVIDYLPKLGTTVRVEGKGQERIPGADFNQALLRIWIGDRPKDTKLKSAMLGTP
jgi:Chalcone isomerase-like